MTRHEIERLRVQTNTLARNILIVLSAMGGKASRGTIAKHITAGGWPPTRGEMTDSISLLRNSGRVEIQVAPGSYSDSSDCQIIAK